MPNFIGPRPVDTDRSQLWGSLGVCVRLKQPWAAVRFHEDNVITSHEGLVIGVDKCTSQGWGAPVLAQLEVTLRMLG